MAEPVSSVPRSSPAIEAASGQNAEPIPWPKDVVVTPSPEVAVSPEAQPLAVYKQVKSGRLSRKLNHAVERGRNAVQDSWDSAEQGFREVGSKLSERWRQLSTERPMTVMAGIVIAGFLVGAGLRMWRRRYE
jgi:hypothetical protein